MRTFAQTIYFSTFPASFFNRLVAARFSKRTSTTGALYVKQPPIFYISSLRLTPFIKYFSEKYNPVGLYASFWRVIMKEAKSIWVLICKVVAETGYTEDAIRAKKKRGEWIEGRHWRKAPDNRLVFDLIAINLWMGGNHA